MFDQPFPIPSPRKKQRRVKFFLLSSFILLLCMGTKFVNFPEFLKSILIWVEHLGFWAPVAFIAIYNLATILFIPGAILTLGGGIIFGVVWGSLYVFIAATLGATFAFLIGRYLSRNWVAKQLEKHPNFQAIDEAVAREGFKIVFLTRLSPIFPFNLLNYAFGLTQVSLKDYCLGSLGMIPGTIMYVYLGSLAGDIAIIETIYCQTTNPQAITMRWVLNGLGFIATAMSTIYLARIAQKTLKASV